MASMTRDLRVFDCCYEVLEDLMKLKGIRYCAEDIRGGKRYVCRITEPEKQTVEAREVLQKLSEGVSDNLIMELI